MLHAFSGTGLFGETYGPGTPTVLALHGWRRDHSDFDATLKEPDELPAVGVDLPGFGATPAPGAPWGSRQYADALLPLVEEMAVPVVVLGHSFGGRVAVELAGAHPEVVRGLVLTGVPLFRPVGARRKSPLEFRLARRLARAGLLSETRMERYRQRYGSADYRAATGVMREVLVRLLAEQYDEVLSMIACPVELVWGDDDAVAPLAVAERALETLGPKANLVVCRAAGHLTPLSVPGELRSAIERVSGARR
ncbi:MAG: alpha/beta hydrolase [Actinomycetota bacterium]|nr:alpha/beta hydrolase [Actinomycetota bacterium]